MVKMIEEILTDPQEHDPENFAYIVHGFLNGVKDPDHFTGKHVCASLIGKVPDKYVNCLEQYGMYGEWGIILDANDKDLLVAWPSDIGSKPEDEKWKGRIRKSLF